MIHCTILIIRTVRTTFGAYSENEEFENPLRNVNLEVEESVKDGIIESGN